jgi:predicted RND superfamily exporter protein
MDYSLIFGLGVSFLFGFMRWRFPAVPKPIATFGIVVGIGLLFWGAFPYYDLRWVAAFILILAIGAAVLDSLLARGRKPGAASARKVDQSVTSHAQSGGITARNVNSSDV